MEKISLLGIILGVLASQGVSYAFAFIFAIICLLIYGNKALVAFIEYPSSIAITLGLGLVSTAIGGFIAMAIAKKSIINAIICGILTLLISVFFLYAIEFKYANDYKWMLVLSLLLTIPSAYLGGYVFLKMHNE
jgi:hypothetical protein